ncbi:MAG: DNA gyrase subunit A [Candidatus Gygaella obscura]|nr:DNA gyrase subunit A [Candidatus Gygaella obscura]
MYTENEKIIPIYIEDEVKTSYLNYSMSVIVGRALPDAKDGLKPVHRRILYSMHDLNLEHNKPFKKCARIVGECLGKYHPHGDMAVYDSLVRMVQDFSLRYTLVDGQGNFGSIDGDPPAAMRYTEARLEAISSQMLLDIEKDTVNFMPNFDDSLKEPVVLPAKLPNLLVNGSSGIAVGMATNMPSHNLAEVVDGIKYFIDNPQCEIKELMKFIKGPDFPTGGLICGRDGIKQAYNTGRGKLTIRAKVSVEQQKQGKESIIITEIPYQVNKTNIVENIARLITSKKIDGISDLRDESDKDGIRVVIELKRDAESQIVLNRLFKNTQLEVTYGIINLALVGGRPKILSLKDLIEQYVLHRKIVTRRKTKFELDKAERRAHILEGLKIALKNIDAIIKTIKTSKSTSDAKNNLVKKFELSEIQAQAILEMQLQRLTALERSKIDAEYAELLKKIEILKSILASEKKIEQIIKDELDEIKKKFADERRTEIVAAVQDIDIEDLIAEEDMVITITHTGYIKRLTISSYRKQRRGGRGVTAMGTKEDDFVERLFVASTKDYLLVFTTTGKIFWLKVYEIPEASRAAKGKAIVNLLQLASGEGISSVVPVKEFSDDKFLVMCTKNGLIKKTILSSFSNPRKAGITAIGLEKDDYLVAADLTDGKNEILVATNNGKSLRFPEKLVRDMGRQAKGVKAINLAIKDYVVGMEKVWPGMEKTDLSLLTVTALGFAKRTNFTEYRSQSRSGKGIINIKVTAKNGEVVSIKSVSEEDEIMAVTHNGMTVRCPVKDIRKTGRSTQGVKLINLEKGDKVTGIAKIAAKDE